MMATCGKLLGDRKMERMVIVKRKVPSVRENELTQGTWFPVFCHFS
jgi:hypothetical protein